jgi:magnesium-transporting ATPase (P-type)
LPDDSTKESLKDDNDEVLENHLDLLGITGLEDLLQDNVAECIK